MTDLVDRLRAAGCVFAEQEARVLRRAGRDPVALERLVARRCAGEPLEHVVGQVRFGRLWLSVGPGVFVPRQRSLLLARTAAQLAGAQQAPVLLEVCAGVAPVAAAVQAVVPAAEVHAADICGRALEHATRNLRHDAQVHRGHLTGAAPRSLRGRVTVLAAVPPYAPTSAAHELRREAREHEPARALFGGPDGLDLVRELVDTAGPWLAPGGQVLVELHRNQWESAAGHARRAGFGARRRDGGDGQSCLLRLQAV